MNKYESQSIIDNKNDADRKISRRGLVKGAVGLMATTALAGCGESAKSSESSPTEVPFEPVSMETVNGSGAEQETYLDPVTFEELSKEEYDERYGPVDAQAQEQNKLIISEITRNPTIYEGRRSPEEFAELAEMSSSLPLERAFNITEEEAAGPEDYPLIFAERLEAALNTGCTLDEVKPYLIEFDNQDSKAKLIDSYLAEMSEKYDFTIVSGLFTAGPSPTTGSRLTREEAPQNTTYILFSRAHRAVLKRFINHIYDTGNMNESFRAEYLGLEYENTKRTGSFSLGMNMRFSNRTVNSGAGVGYNKSIDNYDIVGEVHVGVYPDSSSQIYSTIIPEDPIYHEPLLQLQDI